jgi:hypothetical protein
VFAVITKEEMSEVELIQSLIDDLNELPHRDEEMLDYLRRRTVMIIGKVFGDSYVAKQYKEDISKIEFNARPKYKLVVKERHPGLDPSKPIELKGNVITPPTEQEKDNTWILGKIEMLNILKVKLAAAHPAVELRGMLRAAALVVLVCRTVHKHVALLNRIILSQNM